MSDKQVALACPLEQERRRIEGHRKAALNFLARKAFVGEEQKIGIAMELLSTGGYSVDEAATAGEALAKIRSAQGRYDVVFIANRLGDNPGAWLSGELRQLHADLPVLIAAEDGDVAELKTVFASDRCTGIIGKPYTGTKLFDALGAHGVRCSRRS